MSVGWSGYASGLLRGWGAPEAILNGGVIDFPAIFIALVVTGVLLLGSAAGKLPPDDPVLRGLRELDASIEALRSAILTAQAEAAADLAAPDTPERALGATV